MSCTSIGLAISRGTGTNSSRNRTGRHFYAKARDRARRGQFWSRLTRRPRDMLALSEVCAGFANEAKLDDGIRSVPIGRIRGSQERSGSFDVDFNPLHEGARVRWLDTAAARQQGKALPPVSLVRVADIYFVQDGQHRISVARALGQSDIEARITIWQVTGRVPEARPFRVPSPGRRLPGVRGWGRKMAL